MQFRSFIIPTVALLVMGLGIFCGAEAKTIEAGHATVSWKGQGVIEDLGDGYRVFSGAIRSESTRLNSSHPRLSRMPSSA